MRLLRRIYGLKQSGRLWNQKVIKFFKDIGFISLNADPSILIRKKINNGITIVSIYVDDFLLGSNEIETINGLKEDLKESATPLEVQGGALPR